MNFLSHVDKHPSTYSRAMLLRMRGVVYKERDPERHREQMKFTCWGGDKWICMRQIMTMVRRWGSGNIDEGTENLQNSSGSSFQS